MDIQELLIGILKRHTNSTGQCNFRPFHRGIRQFLGKNPVQFLWNGRIKNHPTSLGHRTDIPKKLLPHRLLPMVHHIVGSQAKSMQGMLEGIFQAKLGGQVIDAGRQVGRLQGHILHLLTGYPLEAFTQRTITMMQRTLPFLAKRPQSQIDFPNFFPHLRTMIMIPF